MIARRLVGFAAALALGLLWAPSASADFGFEKWDGVITANQAGAPYTQAGGHPYQIETTIAINSLGHSGKIPDANAKDILVDVPPGLIGNPTVLPQCTAQQLAHQPSACPVASQVGVIYVSLGGTVLPEPLYNMVPPAGVPARFAFRVTTISIVLDGAVRGEGSLFHLGVDSRGTSQALPFTGARVVFWGVPADPSHDGDRCSVGTDVLGGLNGVSPELCIGEGGPEELPHEAGVPPVPFLTMPSGCTAPGEGLRFDAAIDSWLQPGAQGVEGTPDLTDPAWLTDSFFTHEPAPNEATQRGAEGCDSVPSEPAITVQPTVQSAESPSGLNVELKVPSEGLTSPKGIAQSTLKKVSVTLPQGMTINPSAGEGLGSCTPAQYESETKQSEPGTGCPSDSKIGSVEVDTPLLETPIPGNLYIAQQDNNPFNSLLALYIVAKDPTNGVLIKVPGRVEPNPQTGQLTTTFDNLPQAPFSDFKLNFREGQRSPLSTPPACGTYTTQARFTPWSDPSATIPGTSSFEVTQGVGGRPCPSGATPPFHPQVSAGTLNNNAASYSPFYLRMSRNDGEQEITSFSSHLPPGLSGRLAGIPECSEAQIALARSREHEGGGAQELASPSCPAASEIGHTLVGAGVGSTLAYAPGRVYLAGPYHGSPLSIAAITTATVGPFDLGTVLVRSALRIDPETAQVSVDAAGSDPIPHILDGIPVHVRDIRVYVDRPDFTLNPTSCDPFAVTSTLTGSGADFASAADDVPATISDPFQAANCSGLGFKPKLSFKLRGGTHRGSHPALTATLHAPAGEANIAAAQVTLPHSEFLDNAHIGTVCTRVQFAAGAGNGEKCPAASIYGHATAVTPLLDQPLSGPVYLRSSSHKLPDLVAALNGQINVDLDGRIDTGKGGGIRNTFEVVPDAPVTKFVLSMKGGSKGLLVNSENICSHTQKALAHFVGQNGKVDNFSPAVANSCTTKPKKRGGHKGHRR